MGIRSPFLGRLTFWMLFVERVKQGLKRSVRCPTLNKYYFPHACCDLVTLASSNCLVSS
jgi:hypothetical protein